VRRGFTVLLLAILLLCEVPLLIPSSFGLTDHLLFWTSGHLVVSGGSPYDVNAWIDAQARYQSEHIKFFFDVGAPVWVYPAWTAFLFVPFGLLPYPAGLWALHISYIVVGLLASVLFAWSLPVRWRSRAELAPVVAVVAMFQPLVIANRYGQFGSFLLLGIVLVFLGLRDRKAVPLVVGALLLFTKPQLFLVVAPVVLVLLVRERAWRGILVTSAALAIVALVTTLAYPESLSFFVRGATDRTAVFTTYSSTWAFAHLVAPSFWPVLGVVLVAIAAATSIAAVRRCPPEFRLACVVASSALVSLAITPVDFFYDHVPLVLALVLAVALGRSLLQTTATFFVAMLVPWIAFFAGLAGSDADSRAVAGIVPILFGALLYFVVQPFGRARLAEARPRPAPPISI
jgi:hypothetical protein